MLLNVNFEKIFLQKNKLQLQMFLYSSQFWVKRNLFVKYQLQR